MDIQELGLKTVTAKAERLSLLNIETRLAKGYESYLDSGIADMVFTLDIIFKIENSTAFLMELSRICKNDGVLIIDDGHQSREKTKEKISRSQAWEIIEETKDHLRYRKVSSV